ncbi:hypothetical protein [Wenyingzhuangia aestuarii]|uniref:hypothetical protein n=1 Tax=Wenyingzhuangia aestuarii TaxID=1647582 RepID=UPI001439F111|nr:hypothetical protein [Wenyingzhuangia aestuarii]NJB84233.1 hypothetical protein [Wenyingzhuangia aestuarii]
MREIIQIRWTNFIGLNTFVLLGIISNLLNENVNFLSNLLGFLGIIFGYYFMFIGSWFFFVFLVTEIKFCMRNKKKFINHIFENKIVLGGIIPAIIILFTVIYRILN